MAGRQTGTRPPTANEKKEWCRWGEKAPKWNLAESPDFIRRHVFGEQLPAVDGFETLHEPDVPTLAAYIAANATGKSRFALGGESDEAALWIILRNLLRELLNLGADARSINHVGNWCRVRQIGNIIWQITTRGRFYSQFSGVQLADGDETYEHFRDTELKRRYSDDLIRIIFTMVSYPPNDLHRSAPEIYGQCNRYLGARYDTLRPVPKGLDIEQQAIYHELRGIVTQRLRSPKREPPHLLVITDIAKDYDDLAAMIILKELHRLGIVHLEGFVANLQPTHQRARFGRAALDLLGLPRIEIAQGTDAVTDTSKHVELDHEFKIADAPGGWMSKVPKSQEFTKGYNLIHQTLQSALRSGHRISLLLLSSLQDINEYAQKNPAVFTSAVKDIYLQGGYSLTPSKLLADPNAANNKFNLQAAHEFHNFIYENEIPSTVYTKIPALQMTIPNSDFETLAKTGHPLGEHLRIVQLEQEREFYTKACNPNPEERFAPFMDQGWYLKNKSTWYTAMDDAGKLIHEADELPETVEEVFPFLDRVVVYDALAAIGAAGQDVTDRLGVLDLREEGGERHRVVGRKGMEGREDSVGVHLREMEAVVRALLLGGLLSVQQGIGVSGQARFSVD